MTTQKSTKEDIYNLLERINTDLNDFIKNRIQNGILSDKDWSNLFEKPETKWCWETLCCNKENCAVHKQDDYRCWLIAGTLCGGGWHREFLSRNSRTVLSAKSTNSIMRDQFVPFTRTSAS